MNTKRYVGTYYQESELISKIDELHAQGYREEDLYVVVKDKSDLSMVRGQTAAEVKSTKPSWLDRFMGATSSDEEVRHTFRNLGLSDEETSRHYQDIENGGFVLLADAREGLNFDSTDTSRDISGRYGSGEKTHEAHLNGVGSQLGAGGVGMDGSRDRELDRTNTAGMDRDIMDRTDLTDEQKLQLHEERLQIDKERVQTGEVRVEKEVVEHEARVDVPVEHDEVYVERRSVEGREATNHSFDDTVTGRDEIRVPITEERVNVSKDSVVSEEIVVGKKTVEDTETVRETVRKEEAHIDGEEGRLRDRDGLNTRDDLSAVDRDRDHGNDLDRRNRDGLL